MKNSKIIFTALLACLPCLSALANVTAALDNDHFAMGETIRLVVQSDGSVDGQPDITPLKRDFEILGSSSGSSIQIINGHRSSQTQFTFFIAAKHEGTIQIPPLHWGSQQTAPLELTVSANAAPQGNNAQDAAPSAAPPVFLTATADRKQAYVQEALVLKVRLSTAAQINQASLDLQGNSDVLVKQLGKDEQTSETRKGLSYQVIERKYVLLPQHSGRISLKGPVFDAQVQDTNARDPFDINAFFSNPFGQSPIGRLMSSTRALHLTTKPIELNVLPHPASATGTNWLPAQKLTLEESWKPDNGAVHVGDPLTRHLHLTALGLTGAQLPDLSALMSVPDGIKIYPDQAKTEDTTLGETIVGSRDQDIAMIASTPGHYTLPAVQLFWWDTTSNVQREADLPARTLDILPATGEHITAAPPVPDNQIASNEAGNAQSSSSLTMFKGVHVALWQWISAGLVLCWLGTVLTLWRSRRHATKVTEAAQPAPAKKTDKPVSIKLHSGNAGNALSALKRACRDNDQHAARKHILEWAAGFWPESPPHGLNALALRLNEARFTGPLQELDRACYTDSTWQGEALAQAFAAPPRQSPSEKAKLVIPELYS